MLLTIWFCFGDLFVLWVGGLVTNFVVGLGFVCLFVILLDVGLDCLGF